MNRPLSKHHLDAIRCWMQSWQQEEIVYLQRACTEIRNLLEAEEFWRMAVKNADPVYHGAVVTACMYCEMAYPADDLKDHKPDCPWRLANEDT